MTFKLSSRPLISWELYDFANTIFSAVVLTAFFPLYFTKLAGSNWMLGAATTGTMILAGLVVPFLGALSDQTGKTKTYLIRATLFCIAALIFLSVLRNVFLLLLFFSISCFFYHASLVFYNSLLPVVAAPEKQGFASGLGTGLGYLGVVIALPIATWVSGWLGEASVFATAGLLFLVSSLPLFFFVPERTATRPISFHFSLWKTEWQKLFRFLREIKSRPDWLLFFAGNFFAIDALNTMILWFSVYARETFHPGQSGIISLLIGINLSAFILGIGAGFLTDRWGAMKTLILSTLALALSVIALTLVPDYRSFIGVAVTGGAFSIAGIWTSGRKALLELAPADRTGEFFGVYGLITKVSVIGNLVFSVVADVAGFKMALRVLLFPSLMGFGFLFFCSKIRSRS